MEGATQTCPACAETIRAEAIKCRYCGTRIGRTGALSRTWYRRREGKLLGGVCAGLAAEFGFSVVVVRLAFVVATILGGLFPIPIYVALWMIMPLERPASPATPVEHDLDAAARRRSRF